MLQQRGTKLALTLPPWRRVAGEHPYVLGVDISGLRDALNFGLRVLGLANTA